MKETSHARAMRRTRKARKRMKATATGESAVVAAAKEFAALTYGAEFGPGPLTRRT